MDNVFSYFEIMEKVTIQTESYLFENGENQVRAFPFYELSNAEWVIYEKGQPKYLLDLDNKSYPIVQDIIQKLHSGEELEAIIGQFGRFLGQNWTIKHNIEGEEVEDSQQSETVELLMLADFTQLFFDMTFVATDNIDTDDLLDESHLFELFTDQDEDGNYGLENAVMDTYVNLEQMLSWLFKTKIELSELARKDGKQLWDLTTYKNEVKTFDELEADYQHWIDASNREKTTDEYGQLSGIIGYCQRNQHKKHLLLITERRSEMA